MTTATTTPVNTGRAGSRDTLTTTSPRRRPAATLPATVIAVVFVAIAVVGVHDLLADRGAVSGGPWLDSVVTGLDGLTPQAWTTVVGVVVALIGLWLLWTALRPARRTHQATPIEDGDVWISKRAVARLAEHAAERTAGIESAHVDVRRRALKVRTTTGATGEPELVRTRVQENVQTALEGFSELTVKVRTKEAKNVD